MLNPEIGFSFNISIDIRQRKTFDSKVIGVRVIYNADVPSPQDVAMRHSAP
jgi:hypothetical protein